MSIKSAIVLAWSLAIVAHLFFINNYLAFIFLFAIPQIYKDSKIEINGNIQQNKIHFLLTASKTNFAFTVSILLYFIILLFY